MRAHAGCRLGRDRISTLRIRPARTSWMGRFGRSERDPAKRSDEETNSPARASWLRQSAASSAGLANRPTSGNVSSPNLHLPCAIVPAVLTCPLADKAAALNYAQIPGDAERTSQFERCAALETARLTSRQKSPASPVYDVLRPFAKIPSKPLTSLLISHVAVFNTSA